MALVGDGGALVDQQGLSGLGLPEDNAASLFAWIEGISELEDVEPLASRCRVALRFGGWQSFKFGAFKLGAGLAVVGGRAPGL